MGCDPAQASTETPANPKPAAPSSQPSKPAKSPDDEDPAPRVELKTSLGTITLELNRTKAPITVENFLEYVEAGHYDGTVFHRVRKGFMIQGGGWESPIDKKPTGSPIKFEREGGLLNETGTVAMARLKDLDSATAQFFINVKDNSKQWKGKPGYAVFGKVVDGLDVVTAIEETPVKEIAKHPSYPVTPVTIESVRRL